MPTPDEEIRAFLSGGDADDSRRLDVATLFTRSMLQELRSAVAEWEATAATIEQAHALRQLRQGSASPVAPPISGEAAGRAQQRPTGRGRGFTRHCGSRAAIEAGVTDRAVRDSKHFES